MNVVDNFLDMVYDSISKTNVYTQTISKVNTMTDEELTNDYVYNEMTLVQLSEKYGVSRSTITRRLKTAGITIRNDMKIAPPSKEDIEKIYSQYGCSISSLAKHFKTSNPTARKWLIEYGIEIKDHKQASTEANNKSILNDCPNLEQLVNMVNQGYSITNIKNIFSATTTQVKKWLKDNNLEICDNKYNKKEIPSKKDIELTMSKKLTYKDMCNHYDISYPTLIKWLDFYNLNRDKQESNDIMMAKITKVKMERYGYYHYPTEISNTSKGETELKNYLNSLGGSFKKKHIYGESGLRQEIDMYDEKINIGIEYSGAYWHSEIFKERNYHYKKWKTCADKGIQLLTFWDVEYAQRKPQIISFIKSKMGIFEKRIYAKDTVFAELADGQYSFFEENHIQGKSKIHRNFGLFHDNELVACVSYAKHHRDSSKYTLNRLAFKSGVQVVGGAGKILKRSLSLIDDEVITWSDNRYSTGNIYTQNGFIFDADIPVDYCYFDKNRKIIVSKQSQQKNKVGCPDNMTEKEFCESRGLFRLWDCGKKRFVHSKEKGV